MNGYRQVVHISFVSTLRSRPKKRVPPSRILMWNHDEKLDHHLMRKHGMSQRGGIKHPIVQRMRLQQDISKLMLTHGLAASNQPLFLLLL